MPVIQILKYLIIQDIVIIYYQSLSQYCVYLFTAIMGGGDTSTFSQLAIILLYGVATEHTSNPLIAAYGKPLHPSCYSNSAYHQPFELATTNGL